MPHPITTTLLVSAAVVAGDAKDFTAAAVLLVLAGVLEVARFVVAGLSE